MILLIWRLVEVFGQRVDGAQLDQASIEDESGEQLVTRRIKNRDKHGRQQLPEQLERIEIEHDLDDKNCPACGNERGRIGQEISEQLEYFPASFKVLKHVRHKYACGKCDQDGYDPNIAVAAKPPQPIEKGLAGPSLLAHVITSKLGDLIDWSASLSGSRCMLLAVRCVPGCVVLENW